jgi:hypothetical protein
MSEKQQDDHIWLTVGGSSWAIQYILPPVIYLWRGYYPNCEYSAVDISNVNWEIYYQEWCKMNEVANVSRLG